MTPLKNASSLVLVLVASACGGTVGLGDFFDGGAGSSGSSGSSTGSGSTSGTTGSTGSAGTTTGGTTSGGSGTTTGGTTGTSGSTSGSSGSTTVTGAGGASGTTTGGAGGAGGSGMGGSGGGDVICGGLTGHPCPTGSYCDYPPSANCGIADGSGVCRPKPDACTADCASPGICGCDHKLYCNACVAHSNGVDDSSDMTSCLIFMPGNPPDGGGKTCGTILGLTCDATSYCDFGGTCGGGDQGGVCRTRAQACTADCPGVCGCDGKFYCNACSAQALGVDVSTSRTCLTRDR